MFVYMFVSEKVNVKRDLLHNPEEPCDMRGLLATHKLSECKTHSTLKVINICGHLKEAGKTHPAIVIYKAQSLHGHISYMTSSKQDFTLMRKKSHQWRELKITQGTYSSTEHERKNNTND